MSGLVDIIGQPGPKGGEVATALITLIRHGGELGELEYHTVLIPGEQEPRAVKRVPPVWIKRLERAFEHGAFDRLVPEEIAHRILSTPEPT